MNFGNISCIHHPVNIVFIDDNPNFLQAMKVSFADTNQVLTYTEPKQALVRLQYDEEDVVRSVITHHGDFEQDDFDAQRVNLNIKNLHKVIYDSARFDYTSVIIVDFKMPVMNGVEFCKQIKRSKVKKILLTAEADKDIAVKAFNDGLIDKFISKNSENMDAELKKAVQQLTEIYFLENSQAVMNGLSLKVTTLFSQFAVQDLFKKIIFEFKAVEYYLMDEFGTYVFLDKDANPTWLIFKDDHDYQKQIQLLEGVEASGDMIADLQSRQKLLYLPTEAVYKQPYQKWRDYFFQAKPLESDWYYAVIPKKRFRIVDWDQVVAYQRHNLLE